MSEGEIFRILASDTPSKSHCSRCGGALETRIIQAWWNDQVFSYHPECVGFSEGEGRDVVMPAAPGDGA